MLTVGVEVLLRKNAILEHFSTLCRLETVKSSSGAFAITSSPKRHQFSEIITDFYTTFHC